MPQVCQTMWLLEEVRQWFRIRPSRVRLGGALPISRKLRVQIDLAICPGSPAGKRFAYSAKLERLNSRFVRSFKPWVSLPKQSVNQFSTKNLVQTKIQTKYKYRPKIHRKTMLKLFDLCLHFTTKQENFKKWKNRVDEYYKLNPSFSSGPSSHPIPLVLPSFNVDDCLQPKSDSPIKICSNNEIDAPLLGSLVVCGFRLRILHGKIFFQPEFTGATRLIEIWSWSTSVGCQFYVWWAKIHSNPWSA